MISRHSQPQVVGIDIVILGFIDEEMEAQVNSITYLKKKNNLFVPSWAPQEADTGLLGSMLFRACP